MEEARQYTAVIRLILIATLSLAACDETPSQNDAICLTPAPKNVVADAASTAEEQSDITKSCIHRWAYLLASAPGPNRDVSAAVIGACRDAIDRTFSLRVSEAENGYPDDLWKQEELNFREEALFRVVQGRAGKCIVPDPVAKL